MALKPLLTICDFSIAASRGEISIDHSTPHSAAGLWPCAACGATHYNGCRHYSNIKNSVRNLWRQPLQWVAPHAAQGQRPAAECGVTKCKEISCGSSVTKMGYVKKSKIRVCGLCGRSF